MPDTLTSDNAFLNAPVATAPPPVPLDAPAAIPPAGEQDLAGNAFADAPLIKHVVKPAAPDQAPTLRQADLTGNPFAEAPMSVAGNVPGFEKWSSTDRYADPLGKDCSSFVHALYKRMGVDIPPTAIQQYNGTHRVLGPVPIGTKGTHVADTKSLQPGDLVFFDNGIQDEFNTAGKKSGDGHVNHVGYYLGDGQVVQDNGNGVLRKVPLAWMTSQYRFMGATRPAGPGEGPVGIGGATEAATQMAKQLPPSEFLSQSQHDHPVTTLGGHALDARTAPNQIGYSPQQLAFGAWEQKIGNQPNPPTAFPGKPDWQAAFDKLEASTAKPHSGSSGIDFAASLGDGPGGHDVTDFQKALPTFGKKLSDRLGTWILGSEDAPKGWTNDPSLQETMGLQQKTIGLASFLVPGLNIAAGNSFAMDVTSRAQEVGPLQAGKETLQGMWDQSKFWEPDISGGERALRFANAAVLLLGASHVSVEAWKAGEKGIAAANLAKQTSMSVGDAYRVLSAVETATKGSMDLSQLDGGLRRSGTMAAYLDGPTDAKAPLFDVEAKHALDQSPYLRGTMPADAAAKFASSRALQAYGQGAGADPLGLGSHLPEGSGMNSAVPGSQLPDLLGQERPPVVDPNDPLGLSGIGKITPEQAGAVGDLWQARATAWARATGGTPEDFMAQYGPTIKAGSSAEIPGAAQLGPGSVIKGGVDFPEAARPVITLFEKADVSTAVHESFHIFRRTLEGGDAAIVGRFAGLPDGMTWEKWQEAHPEAWRAGEEKIARAGERYIMKGEAPNSRLAGVFKKFKAWLSEIYKHAKGALGKSNISADVRDVFDRMFDEDRASSKRPSELKAEAKSREELAALDPDDPRLDEFADEADEHLRQRVITELGGKYGAAHSPADILREIHDRQQKAYEEAVATEDMETPMRDDLEDQLKSSSKASLKEGLVRWVLRDGKWYPDMRQGVGGVHSNGLPTYLAKAIEEFAVGGYLDPGYRVMDRLQSEQETGGQSRPPKGALTISEYATKENGAGEGDYHHNGYPMPLVRAFLDTLATKGSAKVPHLDEILEAMHRDDRLANGDTVAGHESTATGEDLAAQKESRARQAELDLAASRERAAVDQARIEAETKRRIDNGEETPLERRAREAKERLASRRSGETLLGDGSAAAGGAQNIVRKETTRSPENEPTTLYQAEEEPEPSGLSRASRAAMAEELGTDGPVSIRGKSLNELYADGKAAVESGSFDAQAQIDRLAKAGHPASAEQYGAFAAYRDDLIAQLRKVNGQLDGGDIHPSSRAAIVDEREKLLDKIRTFDRALDEVKGASGRSLSALRIGQVVSWGDLGAVQIEAERIKGGDLTPKELAQIKGLVDVVAQKNKRIAKLESQPRLDDGAPKPPTMTPEDFADMRDITARWLEVGKTEAEVKRYLQGYRVFGEDARSVLRAAKRVLKASQDTEAGPTRPVRDPVMRQTAAHKEIGELLNQYKKLKESVGSTRLYQAPVADPEMELTGKLARAHARMLDKPTVDSVVEAVQKAIKGATGEDVEWQKVVDAWAEPQVLRPRKEIEAELSKLQAEAKRLSSMAQKRFHDEAQKRYALQVYDVEERIADLKDQLDTGQFKSPEAREPEFDSQELTDLREERDHAAAEVRAAVSALKPLSAAGKVGKYARMSALSSPGTFLNLASAVGGHYLVSPFEEIVGPLIKNTIGRVGHLSELAGSELDFNFKAELRATSELFNSKTYKDMLSMVKTGHSSIGDQAVAEGFEGAREHDRPSGLFGTVLRYEQNLHGAVKTLSERNGFTREFVKELDDATARGEDPDDPQVRLRASARAFVKSQQAKLMNDTVATQLWSDISRAAERTLGKGAARIVVPIAKVPIALAGRALEYTPGGLIKTLYDHLSHSLKGDMTPEMARAISRGYKRGAIGAGLMIWAANSELFDVDEKTHALSIGGWEVPHALMHIPLMETIVMGVYYRKAEGGFLKSLASAQYHGVVDVGKRTAFLNVPKELEGLADEKTAPAVAGRALASLIVPQGLQWWAKLEDPDAKPKGFLEQIKAAFPYLRDQVDTAEQAKIRTKLEAQAKRAAKP